MIETVFDTLNAKAAIYAVKEVFAQSGITLPIMISGTITDASGRTLSGQTTEAFYNSLRHADALTFGLNCALDQNSYASMCRSSRGLRNVMSAFIQTRGCLTRLANMIWMLKRWRSRCANGQSRVF